jgi:hypothetical protein
LASDPFRHRGFGSLGVLDTRFRVLY